MAIWRTWWTKYYPGPWIRPVKVAATVFALGLMGSVLLSNWATIDYTHLRFDLISMLIALLILWMTVWLGALAWAEIVRALYPDARFRQTIRQHQLSHLTKYLPGMAWQQVSKAVQLHRSGLTADRIGLAVVLELGLVVLTGLLTVVLILGLTRMSILGLVPSPFLVWGLAIAILSVCVSAPFIVLRMIGDRFASMRHRRNLIFNLWLVELIQIVGWLNHGVALWFLCRAFTPIESDKIPYLVIAAIMPVLVGLVIFIVPNGFGVRELTMTSLLQVILPTPLAVTTSVMTRTALILAEMAGAVSVLIVNMFHRHT